MNKDISKDSIRAVKRMPAYNSESLNSAMEMAITDQNFLNKNLNLLNGLKFPASKDDIVNHVKNATNDPYMISLFQNLDGYIQFKDEYHVRKAIEENDPKKKIANQITNNTRENPSHTQTAHHTRANNIKASRAVSKLEERKDFPEVNPTAMAEFVCKKYGKSFQTSDDLARHRRFEEGESQARKISQKSTTDRQRTVPISLGVTNPTQYINEEPAENEARDTNLAVSMANMLEGMDFPATKEEIIGHISKHTGNANKKTQRDIMNLIQHNLKNDIKYNSAYEIEKATKLVVKRE